MSYKREWLKTVRYEVQAKTCAPLSIKDGDENIKRDPITNRFIIPGSSIAGAFRNHYEKYLLVPGETNLLFAEQNQGMNRLYCYDSIQENGKNQIGSRPGLKIDSDTLTAQTFGDAKGSGSKFKRNFVPEGASFGFVFELHQYEGKYDFEQSMQHLESLLASFAHSDISLGGHKQIGFGIFEVITITKQYADLSDYDSLMLFMRDELPKESIKDAILSNNSALSKIRFTVEAETMTPILIKDEVMNHHDAPDHMNIMDANGNVIIPGSSLKGVLRNRILRIIETFDQLDRQVITRLFGQVSDSDENESHISRLACLDTIIKQPQKGVYNKIKIDHFTGGVMKGALMNEEVVMGKVTFNLILNRTPKEISLSDMATSNQEGMKEVGLILLVLRELCKGELSIGSGFAVGRGYFHKGSIKLEAEKTYKYDFDQPDQDVEALFNQYTNTLWEG